MALLHTASETRHTIWKPVNKDKFVRTVQEVQKSSAQVPGDAHIHDREIDCAFNGSYQLPRAVGYQLAQDLAFIAAYEEGVHAVSAATVEETTAGQGLMITIASNSGVGPSIGESILGIGKNLEQCAQKGNATVLSGGHLLRRFANGRSTTIGMRRNRFPLRGAIMRTSNCQ